MPPEIGLKWNYLFCVALSCVSGVVVNKLDYCAP